MATDGWAEFAVDLAATLVDLHEDQVCTVWVRRPAKLPEPATQGVLRRMLDAALRRQVRDTDPFVQFFWMCGCLYGNCGGAADSDGWVQLTAQQQAGIEALGWARATGKDRDRWGYPNYRSYFPHADGVLSRPPGEPVRQPYPEAVYIDQAARLAVDTLRGPLGADTPRKLRVTRGR